MRKKKNSPCNLVVASKQQGRKNNINLKLIIMEAKIYGVLNSELCLIDTSTTERGAKQYATRNGYNLIGFRLGYNAFILAEKINGKWVTKDFPYSSNFAQKS